MDIETCRLLARYNAWANAGMGVHIKTLEEGQWKKTFPGYFPSLEAQCNHLYIADFNWLKRLALARDFPYRKVPLLQGERHFGTRVFGDVAGYLSHRAELDELIVRFAGEVEPRDLELRFAYHDSSGARQERQFGGAVLHFFNHQTHHRGMISAYLEGLGVENDYSNLIELV